MANLTLSKTNDLVYRVLTDQGGHVGNLKRINTAWKFKAVGYDAHGDVVPGGGPLALRHNTCFDTVDEVEINDRLGVA